MTLKMQSRRCVAKEHSQQIQLSVDMTKLGFLGTDYKRSQLRDIELIYLKSEMWPTLCEMVRIDSPISELVILATCNRFEIYFSSDDLDASILWLTAFIADTANIPRESIQKIIYPLTDGDVIQHLFNVSAGVESMVFGEDEILSQVKKAYSDFQTLKSTGPATNKLFQTAISVGKRVRHETEISRGAYSVSSIAIDAIRELKLDYFDHSILIVGAGTIGQRAMKKLVSIGHPSLTICNRTLQKASDIALKSGISMIPFEQLTQSVGTYDIVIVATAASDYLIRPEQFSEQSDTSLIVDLTVPRNVDPDTATANRQIISVDGLKQIADKNVAKRRQESLKIQAILDDEQCKYEEWLHRRDVCQR